LNGEYGRVLFERDLALKNLKVANLRRRDDFQQQRNDRVDGAAVGGAASAGREDLPSTESSSTKGKKEHQNDHTFSTSIRQEPCLRITDTEETQSLLNGFTNHIGEMEGLCQDGDINDDHVDDEGDNDDAANGDVECDNVGSDCRDCEDDGSSNDGGDDGDDANDNNSVGSDDNDNNDDDGDDNSSDHDDIFEKEACCSPAGNEYVSRESSKSATSVAKESRFSLPVDNGNDAGIRTTGNTVSRPDNLLANGGTPLFTSNVNPPNPASSNATNVSQGARPKISSQRLALGNMAEPGYYRNSKIPSLEVTGIHQGFLARHSADASLPYTSYPGDFNFPAESTSFMNSPCSTTRGNSNSSMLWSLPPPPGSERQVLRHQRPYSRAMNSVELVHQATGPMLRTDWQFPSPPHTARNVLSSPREEPRLLNLTHPRITTQEEPFARHSISGNFSGATGAQSSDSSNQQSWMPSAYESSWHYPRYDLDTSQPNTYRFVGDSDARSEPAITLPAVISRAPAIILPNVTVPVTEPQSTSSIISQNVSSNSSPFNSVSVSNGNGQGRLNDSTRHTQYITDNRQNRSLTSAEMAAPRSERLSPRNSRSQETTVAPGTSQQGSLTPDSTEDYTLAALERKVAEACAVVERVMRERGERTKARREADQRERDRKERREREVREMREREEREVREREIRERRENEEREARERERRTMGGRAPVQESPRWQCEHYQRRCSVSFPCCGIFYPCHRCHNRSGACDVDDVKANQATHVKCGNCGHEEEINEGSQYCGSCRAKMSEYFCFKCKHFTGVEKNPFHCDKCGICRIYKDKSFHCDVCNVCLDKRLEGKHKCRPDSGHDECCICLEDAFSGCQILPCSHKVHKECAIAMIQNGVRNCPICRHPLFNQDSQ